MISLNKIPILLNNITEKIIFIFFAPCSVFCVKGHGQRSGLILKAKGMYFEMRKILSITLALAMSISMMSFFCACGNNDIDNTTDGVTDDNDGDGLIKDAEDVIEDAKDSLTDKDDADSSASDKDSDITETK